MKQDQTFLRARSVALRALALIATTGAIACAETDDATQHEGLAQQSGAIDGGLVSVTGASADAAIDAGPSASQPKLSKVRVVEGLAAPESAYFDEASKTWFVSNIGAQRVAGDGFISRLDATGALLERELVRGLDDPKGIRVHAGVLYVAETTQIVSFPIADPTKVSRVDVPGAVLLNDVTVDPANGDVYVSDSGGNAIFRLRDGSVSELVRTPKLETPNGLAVKDGTLFIAGLGPDINPTTFATSAPGRVQKLDLQNPTAENLAPVTARIGLLDGLEPLGNGWLLSSYTVGTLYVDALGETTLVQDNRKDGLTASADIGVSSTGLVAVPDGRGTKVVIYSLVR